MLLRSGIDGLLPVCWSRGDTHGLRMWPGNGCQLPNCANIADVFWSGLEGALTDASQGLADGYINDNILSGVNSLFNIFQPKVRGLPTASMHALWEQPPPPHPARGRAICDCCRARLPLPRSLSASLKRCCQRRPTLCFSWSRTLQQGSMPYRAGSRASRASPPQQDPSVRCWAALYTSTSNACLRPVRSNAATWLACPAAGAARLLWRCAHV